jgi:ubiquinone biosynthesis protein UbiJ
MLVRGGDDLPSSAQVSVHGDIELLQRARIAVARLRPDFDEPLARLLGDELAFPLSRAVRQLASVARRTARELGDDVREFVAQESELLAARDDVRDFGDEVDRLRDALERLDKRVSRVAGRLDPTAK